MPSALASWSVLAGEYRAAMQMFLGCIVVSQLTDTSGGVILYDPGKALSGGQFERTGMLNRPPKALLTTLASLQANHIAEDSRVTEVFCDI